jgi:hypothetical protein
MKYVHRMKRLMLLLGFCACTPDPCDGFPQCVRVKIDSFFDKDLPKPDQVALIGVQDVLGRGFKTSDSFTVREPGVPADELNYPIYAAVLPPASFLGSFELEVLTFRQGTVVGRTTDSGTYNTGVLDLIVTVDTPKHCNTGADCERDEQCVSDATQSICIRIPVEPPP